VFIVASVHFVIDSVQKFLDTPSCMIKKLILKYVGNLRSVI